MLRRDGLLTVEPELVVRGRMRPEPRREHACRVEDLVLTAVGERRGARGDVAHHVAARTERRHQVLVERGDERTQTLLGDEVELHALAGPVDELIRERASQVAARCLHDFDGAGSLHDSNPLRRRTARSSSPKPNASTTMPITNTMSIHEMSPAVSTCSNSWLSRSPMFG